MTDHSMTITKNNGGGSNNPMSPLQHGSAYRQAYDSQNSGDPADAKENVMPIVFVAITCVLLLLRLLCYRLQKEQEGGGGDRVGPPPTQVLLPSSRAGGLANRDPLPPLLSSSRTGGLPNRDRSRVAVVEMAPAVPVQPPLVCTYWKADGWGDDSCGVCLAEFADGEALRVLPACMHFFHDACVNEWLRRQDTCPLCRSPLVAPADNT